METTEFINISTGFFIWLVIYVAVFFALRGFFTWYLKTTKIVSLLEQIERNTRPEGRVTEEEKIMAELHKDEQKRDALFENLSGPYRIWFFSFVIGGLLSAIAGFIGIHLNNYILTNGGLLFGLLGLIGAIVVIKWLVPKNNK